MKHTTVLYDKFVSSGTRVTVTGRSDYIPFSDLWVDRTFAVQAERTAPVEEKWDEGWHTPDPVAYSNRTPAPAE